MRPRAAPRIMDGMKRWSLALLPVLPLVALPQTAPPQQELTVYFITSTQCPVVQQYASRMQALGTAFGARGIRFVLLNPNDSESEAAFTTWARERSLTLPRQKDPQARLAQKLGAVRYPEAIVVDGAGVVRYRGRIDDNRQAALVRVPYLQRVLEALLENKPAPWRVVASTEGCELTYSPSKPSSASAPVTFSKDIAPILNNYCVRCHRPGDVGPMPLTSYAQVKPWATMIRSVTQRRTMPPWKAAEGFGQFHDSQVLTASDRGKLARWAAQGAPEGDPTLLPKPPVLPKPGSWPLGTPDLVLQPKGTFMLAAEGADEYRNYVLPADFTQERFLSGLDFQPGNRAAVHHMILYVAPDPTKTARDGEDGPGIPGWHSSGTGDSSFTLVDGWAPGMNRRPLPTGTGIRIPKGAKLVLEVHYHRTGRLERDRSTVALYFRKAPVRRELIMESLMGDLHIPAGAKNYQTAGELEVPEDLTLYSILPHMHLLGKKMQVWAELPGGKRKPLIKIDDWDFNWQLNYWFKEPIKVPRGSKLKLTALYDNSEANPRQPSRPPKDVTFGEETTDEMCLAFFNFTRDNVTLRRRSGQ